MASNDIPTLFILEIVQIKSWNVDFDFAYEIVGASENKAYICKVSSIKTFDFSTLYMVKIWNCYLLTCQYHDITILKKHGLKWFSTYAKNCHTLFSEPHNMLIYITRPGDM